jgi:hypothetical protein
VRVGGQYIASQGQEWTGIRTTTQEGDFQVSKRVNPMCRQKALEKGVSNRKRIVRGVTNLCLRYVYFY